MVPKALLAVLALTNVVTSVPVAKSENAQASPEHRGLTIPMKWIAPSLIGGIVLDRWESEGAQGIIGDRDPPRPSNPGPNEQPMFAPVPSRPSRFFEQADFLPRDVVDNKEVKDQSSSVTTSPPKRELQARARPWVWIAPSLLAGSLLDRFLFGHHRPTRPASPMIAPQTAFPYSPYPPAVSSPYMAGRPMRPMPPTEIYPRGFDPEVVSKVMQFGPEAAMTGKSLLAPLAITGSSVGMEGMLESDNGYPAYQIRADRPSDVSTRNFADEVSLSRRGISWKWLLGGAALGGLVDHFFFGGSSAPPASTPTPATSGASSPDLGKGDPPDGSTDTEPVQVPPTRPHHVHPHGTPPTDPTTSTRSTTPNDPANVTDPLER